MTENDKKDVARSIAKADPKRVYTEEHIAEKLGVIRQTVNNWISDIRAAQRAGRDAKIIRLSRLGWTQEEIAEVVGITHGRVAQIVNNTKFGEINNFLEQGKEIGWIAEHDENVVREDFLPSEAVAIWQAMESYQAKERDEKGKFVHQSESDQRRNRAAKVVGMSHDTLSKAKQIVEAAEKDPEKYRRRSKGLKAVKEK